jgi:hypothetical protein
MVDSLNQPDIGKNAVIIKPKFLLPAFSVHPDLRQWFTSLFY